MGDGGFTDIQKKIFDLLKKNPSISITEISRKLKRSRPTIYRELRKMIRENNLTLTAIATPSAQKYKFAVLFMFNLQFHRGEHNIDELLNYFRNNKHVAFFTLGKGYADASVLMFYEDVNKYLESTKTFQQSKESLQEESPLPDSQKSWGGKRVLFKTTKFMIIDILSREAPLTAKSIYFRLKRVYGKEITYQAAHKFLREMTREMVILKKERLYFLHPSWITKLKKFYNNLREDYILERTDYILVETFEELKNFMEKLLRKAELAKLNLLPFPVIDLEGKAKIICKSCSLNKILSKIYEIKGFEIEFTNGRVENEVVVTEKEVYNVFYNKKFITKLTEVMRRNYKEGEIILLRPFEEIYKEKTSIEIIKTKNEKLAEKIKKSPKQHTELTSFYSF